MAKKNPVIFSCGFHIDFEKSYRVWLQIAFFPEKNGCGVNTGFPKVKKACGLRQCNMSLPDTGSCYRIRISKLWR